jgi:predicted ATPase
MQNFRSFVDSGRIELGAINVLIGANNSGKSTVLRGLHQLQHGLTDLFGDVRVGSTQANIEIELTNVHGTTGWRTAVQDSRGETVAALRISAHHGRHFRLNVDAISA